MNPTYLASLDGPPLSMLESPANNNNNNNDVVGSNNPVATTNNSNVAQPSIPGASNVTSQQQPSAIDLLSVETFTSPTISISSSALLPPHPHPPLPATAQRNSPEQSSGISSLHDTPTAATSPVSPPPPSSSSNFPDDANRSGVNVQSPPDDVALLDVSTQGLLIL